MGVYLNPPNILKQKGRKLQGNSYDELVAEIKPNELLFGSYNLIRLKVAKQLDSNQEMASMTRQVYAGEIFHEGFFAVKISEARQYADETLKSQQVK